MGRVRDGFPCTASGRSHRKLEREAIGSDTHQGMVCRVVRLEPDRDMPVARIAYGLQVRWMMTGEAGGFVRFT